MKRVLLIDDQPEICNILKTIFKIMLNDIILSTTTNPRYGIELANRNCFDMYIVDIVMPKCDGITLAKSIHAISDKPILIITGSEITKNDIDDLKGNIIKGVIMKPFNLVDLINNVEKHI